jgi:hypothetical protein
MLTSKKEISKLKARASRSETQLELDWGSVICTTALLEMIRKIGSMGGASIQDF